MHEHMTLIQKSLRSIAVAVLLLATLAPEVRAQAPAGQASSYPVRLEGCPSEVHLQIPSQFSRARGPEEVARRDAILDRLHSNPGRKARYSDVFLSDWKADSGFPQISVASLGSVIQRQGQITDAEWQRIKKEIMGASQAQRERWVAQHIEKLKPGLPAEIRLLKSKVAAATEEKPNSIVALGTFTAVVSGRTFEYHSAAKFIYSKRCVVYLITAVDASRPRAVEELTQFVSLVEVE